MRWIIAVFALFCATAAFAAAPTTGPREPLTTDDFGLYGGWNEYFVSPDSPFTFLIVQAISDKDGLAWHSVRHKDRTQWNEYLLRARANGVRVIADISPAVLDEKGEERGFDGITENTIPMARYYELVDLFFENVDYDQLYAVTIGEEHVFWNGQKERLIEMYDYIKKKYPTVPLWQWWTPSSRGSIPGLNYPNIPADGWAFDEYHMLGEDLELGLRGFALLQKPLVNTLWAAGPLSSIEWSEANFWENYFMAKKYGTPMAFFCWTGREKDPSDRWGWDVDCEQVTRDIFLNFCVKVAKGEANVPPNPYSSDWDVVQWKQKVNTLSNDAATPTKWTYREVFKKERELAFMTDAYIRGFANLGWDSSSLWLKPRQAGMAEATLDYLFECPPNLEELRAKVEGAGRDGSKISVAIVDGDGNVLASKEGKSAEVVHDMRAYRGKTFRVLFTMSGTSLRAGNIPAEISSLSVTATTKAP